MTKEVFWEYILILLQEFPGLPAAVDSWYWSVAYTDGANTSSLKLAIFEWLQFNTTVLLGRISVAYFTEELVVKLNMGQLPL